METVDGGWHSDSDNWRVAQLHFRGRSMSIQTPIRIETKANMAEFSADLKKIIEGSKRDGALVVNSRALHVAKRARELTPIASREEILRTFNVVKVAKVKKAGKNKGQIGWKTAYNAEPWASHVVLAKMKKRGQWPPASRAEIDKEVRNFISRKLSAVGSLRAGWRGIVGPLQQKVRLALNNVKAAKSGKFLASVKKAFELGKAGDKSEDKKIRHEAGTVSPAVTGSNMVCTGSYKVSVKRGGSRKIDGRVTNALNSAMRAEQNEMRQHLEERVKAQWEATQKRLSRRAS